MCKVPGDEMFLPLGDIFQKRDETKSLFLAPLC